MVNQQSGAKELAEEFHKCAGKCEKESQRTGELELWPALPQRS
jgi:hypothetical protein